VCFGIVGAACTLKIYGTAFWNPGLLMYQILAENDSSATRFACFLCSFIFMVGCVGTNYVANLLPFGVDCSGFAPRYLNITRSQILCEIIGAWIVVPWKVLTSGESFLTAIIGMGIFVACLLGIMVSDYYFVRQGNYWIEDLYTDDPKGRYWYTGGFHWRAYVAYFCGIVVPFPGFVGAIGGGKLSKLTNGAAQVYSIGYLLSFCIGGLVYFILCKISPPPHIEEARALPFESMGAREVLIDISRPVSIGQDSEDIAVESSEVKGHSKADM
jgi:NCS1 family nucleobase:cation symporter-1